MRSTPEIRYNMIHPQEDCSSLAETLPVSTPKMASTATSSSRRRNRVRFELGASQSYESANSSMEDCADCWYKAQDYATFKADSIQQGKDIRRKEREYGPEFATYEIVLERVLGCSGRSVRAIGTPPVDDGRSVDDRHRPPLL